MKNFNENVTNVETNTVSNVNDDLRYLEFLEMKL